jgi:hypothetical protein
VSKRVFLKAFFTLFLLVPGTQAYAYLEPGTGSMLLQLLLGGASGVAVVMKLYWHNLVAFFARIKK